VEEPIPAASYKAVMIQHPVANYSVWQAAYMAHDSVRNAYGISKYGLGRGTQDTNMVWILNKINDLGKAKEFAGLPELKTVMEAAGVTGMPTFTYMDVVRDDTSSIPQKDRVLVSHKVKDYDTWLKAYDGEGRAMRAENGLLDRGLARNADDPNTVYIVFAITDKDKAMARMQSEELKKIMTDAGVEGPPSFFFYTLQN
jgi:quinol monooxygenase YgiN